MGAEAKGATQQAAEAILKGGGSQPIITVSNAVIFKLLLWHFLKSIEFLLQPIIESILLQSGKIYVY